ncbi:MAG: hypothetical protein C0417_03280 [Chlorobiaceae bacterium]|nr:hypothetical protein [Chlorobiaceae bacterium]
MDTIKLGYPFRLALKGVQQLSEVSYLRYDPKVPPRTTPKYPTILAGTDNVSPTIFSIAQNYPNPFNPITTISFNLPVDALVTLRIYNTLGQEVATLLNQEKLEMGEQEIEFNGSQLSSGVYFYQLEARDISTNSGQSFIKTKKLILMK